MKSRSFIVVITKYVLCYTSISLTKNNHPKLASQGVGEFKSKAREHLLKKILQFKSNVTF